MAYFLIPWQQMPAADPIISKLPTVLAQKQVRARPKFHIGNN